MLAVTVGVTLWTPHTRTALTIDMRWFAAQSVALANGRVGAQAGPEIWPVFYPAGVPLLAAVPQWVLGRDLRHGVYSIWLCGVIAVLGTVALGRRVAGVWCGLAAGSALLGSLLFRFTTGLIASSVPGALVTVLVLICYLHGGRRGWLVAAGLLATLAGAVRLALLTLPVSLLAAELVVGAWHRDRRRRWMALASGVGTGTVILLVHNRIFFGAWLRTGVANRHASFSWRWLLHPTDGEVEPAWTLVRGIVGLSASHAVPVFVAALTGLVWLWRRGDARHRSVAVACASIFVLQCLLLGLYFFRATVYLIPTLPALALLAGCAVGALGPVRWRPAVAGVLALACWQAVPPIYAKTVDLGVASYEQLLEMDRRLETNAALVGCRDPLLVMNTIARKERTVRCLAAGEASLPADAPVGPLEARQLVARLLAEGRPVYLDRHVFPREADRQHEAIEAILAGFPVSPVGLGEVVRVGFPQEPATDPAAGGPEP